MRFDPLQAASLKKLVGCTVTFDASRLGLVWVLFCLSIGAGCPKQASLPHTDSPQRPRETTRSVQKTLVTPAPRLRATITLQKQQGKAQVHLVAQGAERDLQRWVRPGSLQAETIISFPRQPEASCLVSETQELRLSGVQGTQVELRYTVPLSSDPKHATPSKGILLRGSDLLAYPSSWRGQTVDFDLAVVVEEGEGQNTVATSTGPWSAIYSAALPGGLKSWAALVGPVQHTRFEDQPGRRDSFAVLGNFVFDARWFSAELAGIRSAVDDYFASPHSSEHNTLLYATAQSHHPDPMSIESTNGGLLMSLSPDASWDSPKRIALTQFLVRKKLVGLWDYAATPSPPWSKAAFEQGCARQIARSLLFDQGFLSAQEYADDLNQIESASLDPLREKQATLARAIRAGAALCRKLDLALQQHQEQPSALKYWIHDMRVRRAQAAKALSLDAGRQGLRSQGSYALWDKVMREAMPLQAESRDLAPCLSLATGRFAFYDLGPVDPVPNQVLGPLSTFASQEVGLRADDIFVSRMLDDPHSPDKVEMKILRQGVQQSLAFRPPVHWQKGSQAERIARIPDSQCRL